VPSHARAALEAMPLAGKGRALKLSLLAQTGA
jgi:hypothetical protein